MKKFLSGFHFAWSGLIRAVSEQRNMKIHITAAAIVIGLGFYFGITPGEWIAVTLSIGFVLTAELLNTAIENVVDLVSPERNPLAGKIKDIAAAGVLVSAVAAAIAGSVIFVKYLF